MVDWKIIARFSTSCCLISYCLSFLIMFCVGKMVLHVPFLHWDSIGNPSSSAGTAFYCLETAAREHVITALTLRTEDNRLIYRASVAYSALCVFSVCAYREL